MGDKALNDLMEFDHVIQVHPDGTITEPSGVYAPEISLSAAPDGQISAADDADMVAFVKAQGWELLTGFTGQYGYSGPLMHPSEYVGGGLEKHIRETPGVYVACVADVQPDGAEESESVGWVVAYRETLPGKGA